MDLLSGDQKGTLARSVPGKRCAASESRGRSQSPGISWSPAAPNTIYRPSGETAPAPFRFVKCMPLGGLISNCAESDSGVDVLRHRNADTAVEASNTAAAAQVN